MIDSSNIAGWNSKIGEVGVSRTAHSGDMFVQDHWLETPIIKIITSARKRGVSAGRGGEGVRRRHALRIRSTGRMDDQWSTGYGNRLIGVRSLGKIYLVSNWVSGTVVHYASEALAVWMISNLMGTVVYWLGNGRVTEREKLKLRGGRLKMMTKNMNTQTDSMMSNFKTDFTMHIHFEGWFSIWLISHFEWKNQK